MQQHSFLAAALVLAPPQRSCSWDSASSSSPARCPCTSLCFRHRAHRLVTRHCMSEPLRGSLETETCHALVVCFVFLWLLQP